MKLLIVDDHRRIRETIKLLLSEVADEILEAADGTEAVAACAVHQPDWILMDIEMKEMDGIEATRRIKANIPNARILVLTSFNDDSMRASALAAGAVGFMLKDDLSHVAEFLREFPCSRPHAGASHVRSVSAAPARGRAVAGDFDKAPTKIRNSSRTTAIFNPNADTNLELGVPTLGEPNINFEPEVWAASCRDCAVHALNHLNHLQFESNQIRRATRAIQCSLEPSLWSDAIQLDPIKGSRAFREWHQAVRALTDLLAELSAKQISDENVIRVIEEAIEYLLRGTVMLITQTLQLDGDLRTITNPTHRTRVDEEQSKALVEIARADAKWASNEYDLAVLHYGKAWLHASFPASLARLAKN